MVQEEMEIDLAATHGEGVKIEKGWPLSYHGLRGQVALKRGRARLQESRAEARTPVGAPATLGVGLRPERR